MVRGDVHAIVIAGRRGHVQRGRRFAVVVQSDDPLALSTVVVCLTSTATPAAIFHPEIVLGEESTRLMCEMVGAVDVRGLSDQAGQLTREDMPTVDDALELVLDLV